MDELLEGGSEETRHVTVIGVLESVKNLASHEHGGYRALETRLGPAHRK